MNPELKFSKIEGKLKEHEEDIKEVRDEINSLRICINEVKICLARIDENMKNQQNNYLKLENLINQQSNQTISLLSQVINNQTNKQIEEMKVKSAQEIVKKKIKIPFISK